MSSLPCPVCRQDYIWMAVFCSHPELPFLMCKECDSTWEIGELQPANSNFESLAERCERLKMEERWNELVFTKFSRTNET